MTEEKSKKTTTNQKAQKFGEVIGNFIANILFFALLVALAAWFLATIATLVYIGIYVFTHALVAAIFCGIGSLVILTFISSRY